MPVAVAAALALACSETPPEWGSTRPQGIREGGTSCSRAVTFVADAEEEAASNGERCCCCC